MRYEFRIFGLDCAEEVSLLKRELQPLLEDEERLSFDLLNGRLRVDTTGLPTTEAQLFEAIARTGLRAEPYRPGAEFSENQAGWLAAHGRTLLTAFSGLCGAAALSLQLSSSSPAPPGPAIALYLLSVFTGVASVLPKAWRSLISLRPDMNLLMTVAVLGALLIQEWFEAAAVAFLFSFSLLLESWSIGRARRAIGSLLDLSPPIAHVRGSEETIADRSPADVDKGSVVVVRPGEKIPLDGVVTAGSSAVNQSPITGESAPVLREVDDEVYAGSINGDGLLEVRTTKRSDETTLARIIRMVEEAGSRRAPAEKWVERFAAIYTPVVMSAAALVLLVPPLLLGGDWSDWVYQSLVLLVIACPCALVISTPVSVVAALAAAARQGVLIKGGVFVELPARLKAIALDKTGTLTQGVPRVIDVAPMNGHDADELLVRAAALETNSNHPLAQAVTDHARRRGLSFSPAEEFQSIPGRGAEGRIDDRLFWVGSRRHLEERAIAPDQIQDTLQQLRSQSLAGRSVVIVGNDRHVCGFITLADVLRDEARDAVTQLREAGVEHIVMLTGDNQATANWVASEAAIDEVQAELLPEQKVAAVEALVARRQFVAMVGDGVNDAPAMARATIGIAMGAAGSDAAIETADVALMSDDLSKLPWLVRHSRATLRVIRQNIVFALGIKLIFFALALSGNASLWAAIAADMGASLLVIANGLRLLRS